MWKRKAERKAEQVGVKQFENSTATAGFRDGERDTRKKISLSLKAAKCKEIFSLEPPERKADLLTA